MRSGLGVRSVFSVSCNWCAHSKMRNGLGTSQKSDSFLVQSCPEKDCDMRILVKERRCILAKERIVVSTHVHNMFSHLQSQLIPWHKM